MLFRIEAAKAKCDNKCVRRHPRAIFSVPLTLHHLTHGGVEPSHGITLDVSEGGMGALVQHTLNLGEMVAVDLPLREQVLHAIAIVRHMSKTRCGFEFIGLTEEERSRIRGEAGVIHNSRNGLAPSR
jgi:c-di-GMP-binding flagellar brake protein YcgR